MIDSVGGGSRSAAQSISHFVGFGSQTATVVSEDFQELDRPRAAYVEHRPPADVRSELIRTGQHDDERVVAFGGCHRRDGEKALLDSYVAAKGPDISFDLVGEQMDTPAFNDDDVANVFRQINRLPKTTVPLVLGHHNILPQATPRVALYTEVLNGGLVRNRFASCDRAVIYCHGHIHDDPVEVLSLGGANRGKLVSVSAPEFANGFNVIELHFSEDNMPIGCTVHRYRTKRHQGIEAAESYRIPLHVPADGGLYTRELVGAVVEIATNENQRFKHFVDQVRALTRVRHQQNTIAGAILEADWLSLVSIGNRDDDPRHWLIRRANP